MAPALSAGGMPCRCVSTPTSRRSTPTVSSARTQLDLAQVDREAVQRPAHQPRRRRRGRPGHLGEAARADPRHSRRRAATPRTASSLVQTAEGALERGARRSSSASASWPSSTTTAPSRRATAARSRPRSGSCRPRSSGSRARRRSTSINLLGGNSTITFQVGANSGETITMSTIPVFGGAGAAIDPAIFQFGATRRRHRRDRPGALVASPTRAPGWARSRTGSSTRSTTWPSTTRTCRRRNRASATSTWPPR